MYFLSVGFLFNAINTFDSNKLKRDQRIHAPNDLAVTFTNLCSLCIVTTSYRLGNKSIV